ncbi:MAG TPA: hypothetical protein ENJ79_10680 [Gammaproteobacteria bacterium]|nr:hypothetical protein [Gammaproteobacteria bacterium]
MTTEVLNLSIGDVIPRQRLNEGFEGQARIYGKRLRVYLTRAALAALAERTQPLVAELELYFSCLVRKQVRFQTGGEIPAADEDCAPVTDGLFLRFRAVTTAHCRIDETDGKPPVETMPVKKPGLFTPDWVRIDFRAGRWLGEYGFRADLNTPSTHTGG